MARPREFDRDEALSKAVEVFWTYGYEATTMTDLRKALGIGRQSLYATFGDKPKIFDEALRRYLAMTEAMFARTFGPDAGIDDVRAHLSRAARGLAGEEQRRGCLIMNTCIERAPHDPGAAALVQQGLGVMRGAFSRALENSRARGDIPAATDVEASATSLVALNAGMAVLARSGASPEELIDGVDAAMRGLLG